jgi:DNA primase
MADRARGKFDMRSAEGKVAAFKWLLPAVQKVPDKLERAAVVNDMAGYLGVDPSMVLDQFKRASNERRSAAPAVARAAMPASERILLEALLSSTRVRRELLPQFQPDMIEGLLSREIIEAFRHIESDDPARVFADVEGRLTESSRALLHDALATDLTEEGLEEEFAWTQATACLERLQSDVRKRRVADLKARVKAAEREGRSREALTLYGELEQLEREQRSRAS